MTFIVLALLAAHGACVPVEGDHILMKHLAGLETAFATLPPDQPAGYAPAPGARRILSKAELERLAATHGVSLTAASEICLERTTEPLTRERLLEALDFSLNGSGARLELLDFSRQPVPRGPLEFPRSGLLRTAQPGLAALWHGRVKYGSSRSIPVWAKVRLSISGTRVLAVENLPPGRVIRAEQVKLDSCELFPFAEPPAQSPEGVVGLAPRRLIRAGQAVLPGLLSAARDVEKGETVSVAVASGGAQLKFAAQAESGGRSGEFILVRNPASGKRFRARVERKGKVVVDADGGGVNAESIMAGASDSAGTGSGEHREGKDSQEIAHR